MRNAPWGAAEPDGQWAQMGRTMGTRHHFESRSAIDSFLEKPLLGLHQAMNVESLWKAVQQLLSVTIPNHLIRLSFQHDPVLPAITRCTRPLPSGLFATEPLKSAIHSRSHRRLVRISELFRNERSLLRSTLCRRYLARQNCRYGVVLLFRKSARLISAITILRTAIQGDLLATEIRLLRQLHPQFLAALHRLGSLEREHAVRIAFEEFVRKLPVPTILLRWNLRPLYQNRAARDFCTVWDKGPSEARLMKAHSPVPGEILDRCRRLKHRWARVYRPNPRSNRLKNEQIHHPRLPLRATIRLKQPRNASLVQPNFLIECEDLRRQPSPSASSKSPSPYLLLLTDREREVARLVCDGRSNQEIANEIGLSLPTVKKHVHVILGKLEVNSRTQLLALMR